MPLWRALRRWWFRAASLGLALAPPAGSHAVAGDLSNVLRYNWGVVGGSPNWERVEADGNAIDSTGAVILGGVFGGTTQFDTSFRKNIHQLTSRGDGDIFLMKLSRNGELLWIKQFGGPGNDNIFDLTVDQQDNIIISGWFAGEVAFGSQVLRSRGGQDAFLGKVSLPEVLWVQPMGGALDDGANEVAIDPQGNLLASAMSIGPFKVGDLTFQNGGRYDAYILKFDPNGRLIWARGTNGSGLERIRAISSDGLGNVYVGYQVKGTFQIGSVVLPGTGGWDGVMTKWSPNGELLWYSHLATPGEDGVSGSAGTREGAGYFTGAFDGQTVVGGMPVDSGGKRSAFLFRLSPDNRPEWMVTLTGEGPAGAFEMVTTPSGDALISGAQKGRTVVRRNGRQVGIIPATTGGRREASAVLISRDGQVIDRLGPSGGGDSTADTCDIGPDGKTFAQTTIFNGEIAYGRDRFVGPGRRNFLLVLGTINPP